MSSNIPTSTSAHRAGVQAGSTSNTAGDATTIKVVKIRPVAPVVEDGSTFMTFEIGNMPRSLYDNIRFEPSHVAATIGLPYQAGRFPGEDARVDNPGVKGLFMVIDPEKEEFGKVRFKDIYGAVVVAMADGSEGEVTVEKVKNLLGYTDVVAKEVREYLSGGYLDQERADEAKEVRDKVLTKAAFVEWVRKEPESGEH